MNLSEVITDLESTEIQGFFARMCARRLEVLHLPRDLSHQDPDAFQKTLRTLLSRLLARHSADLMANMHDELLKDEPKEITDFLEAQLAKCNPDAVVHREDWRFPDRADGRDQTRLVHVALRNKTVETVEVAGCFDRGGRWVGNAIMEALNQALERRESDVKHLFERYPVAPVTPADREELLERIRALR